MTKRQYQEEIARLRRLNQSLWDALKQTNIENENLTAELTQATIDIGVLQTQVERLSAQVEVLKYGCA